MDIYSWKRDYKFVHSRMADFTRKQKRVFPIILNKCTPSLRSQLEGAKIFEEATENNDIVELFKLSTGFCCRDDQNNDNSYAVFNNHCALVINFQKMTQGKMSI